MDVIEDIEYEEVNLLPHGNVLHEIQKPQDQNGIDTKEGS